MKSARVVLVTNVGQGFGRAVALSFGHAGYDVVCADPDVDFASKTAAEVEEVGGQSIPVQVDMTSLLEVRSAFAKVFEIFGVLGGVVHVANQSSNARFDDLSESEFAELLREDVTSTFLLLRTANRLLRSGWVVIVTPPGSPEHPQMAGIQGAIVGLATALADAPERTPVAVRASDGYGYGYEAESDAARPRINVVVPSRAASDPRSDAALVHAVRFLGSAAASGMQGALMPVQLPPPPKVVETLLPEVQAALDDTVRQGDLDDDVDLPYAFDDSELRDEIEAAGLDDGALERADAALERLEEAAEEADTQRGNAEDTAARLRWEASDMGGWQR